MALFKKEEATAKGTLSGYRGGWTSGQQSVLSKNPQTLSRSPKTFPFCCCCCFLADLGPAPYFTRVSSEGSQDFQHGPPASSEASAPYSQSSHGRALNLKIPCPTTWQGKIDGQMHPRRKQSQKESSAFSKHLYIPGTQFNAKLACFALVTGMCKGSWACAQKELCEFELAEK